ncbi:3014_t:CDS:1, partial [Funneliformis caledonium]
ERASQVVKDASAEDGEDEWSHLKITSKSKEARKNCNTVQKSHE